MSQRVCFVRHVRADRLDEYRRRHAEVWPEMLAEIAASGRSEYSLFVQDDGLLVGVYETSDVDASDAYLAASQVAGRWEAEMSQFFVEQGRADQDATVLPEVFDLGEQLARAQTSPSAPRPAPNDATRSADHLDRTTRTDTT